MYATEQQPNPPLEIFLAFPVNNLLS